MIKMPLPRREPPKVEFSELVKISVDSKPPSRSRWKVLTKQLLKGLQGRRMFRKPIVTRSGRRIEGMVLSIKKSDMRDMEKTLDKFGGRLVRGTAGVVGGWLNDIAISAGDAIHREIFDMIGSSAAQHMKIEAYKLPHERRGWPPSKAMKGTIQEHPESWFVGGYRRAPQTYRTGWLEKSIGYKVIRKKFPRRSRSLLRLVSERVQKKYREQRKQATGLIVGPGAGRTPAPPYAWIVNEGAGPVQGMFFLPSFRDGGYGRMIQKRKGGKGVPTRWWGGFEGKMYLEGTGLWLIRETPKMQLNAARLARIHVSRAFAEYKNEVEPALLTRGVGFDSAKVEDLIARMEVLIEMYISQRASVSTKIIAQNLKEAMMIRGPPT